MVLSNKKKYKYILILVLTSSFIILSILAKSRALIIGYSVSLYQLTILYRQKAFSWKINLIIITGFSISFLCLSAFYKSNSSLGRLLVYKVSFKILKNHFIAGVGLNKFGNIYRHYQADYFRSGSYTTKELLLADNTQHAFNDYLQFAIEFGVLGIIIIFVVITLIASVINKAIKNNSNISITLVLACIQLIAISVAALFMHEFEKLHIQLIFVSSLFIVFCYAYKLKKKITLITYGIILSFLFWIHFGYYLNNYRKYEIFKDANNLFQCGYINESIRFYRNLYPYLNNDVSYLSYYAKALEVTSHYDEAIKILEKAISIDNSYSIYLQLANCYLQNKMFVQAENCYLIAVYMVPSRFVSRFELFQFYLTTNQQSKAFETGKNILNLPVKVSSSKILRIKEDVQKYFNHISKF